MMAKRRKRGRPKSGSARTPAERMRAYRARKRAAGLRSVSKWVADEGLGVRSGHRLNEVRSLVLHMAIVRKIDRDPDLLEIPSRNLRRWRAAAGDQPRVYLAEWEQVLARPWPEVAEFATSFSERAVRLRQSSPFAGVLDARERKRIYAAFRA